MVGVAILADESSALLGLISVIAPAIAVEILVLY